MKVNFSKIVAFKGTTRNISYSYCQCPFEALIIAFFRFFPQANNLLSPPKFCQKRLFRIVEYKKLIKKS
jgi:hypothetical protein